jgi:hypothetical protein
MGASRGKFYEKRFEMAPEKPFVLTCLGKKTIIPRAC